MRFCTIVCVIEMIGFSELVVQLLFLCLISIQVFSVFPDFPSVEITLKLFADVAKLYT